MTEEEKQVLMQNVINSVQDYFDNYDWDKKFIAHFGEHGVKDPNDKEGNL